MQLGMQRPGLLVRPFASKSVVFAISIHGPMAPNFMQPVGEDNEIWDVSNAHSSAMVARRLFFFGPGALARWQVDGVCGGSQDSMISVTNGKSVFADVDATNAIDRIELHPDGRRSGRRILRCRRRFRIDRKRASAFSTIRCEPRHSAWGRTAKRWRSALSRVTPDLRFRNEAGDPPDAQKTLGLAG